MPPRDIALALSGGGYRAAFFHLGVMQKLHELALLERVAVISSVSGGSIIAGAYAQSLLDQEDFPTFLAKTQRFLQSETLDRPALLSEILPWQTSARKIQSSFERFFSPEGRVSKMSDLGRIAHLRFIFNATAVHSGRGWRFISGGSAEEWELGQTHEAAFSRGVDRYLCDVPLAKAVTASAAFPLFSAVTINRRDVVDIPEGESMERRDFYQDLPDPVCLSDGGVRDNTGLTSIIAGYAPPGYEADYYLIGSDAGAIVNLLHAPPVGLRRFLDLKSLLNAPPRGRLRKVRYILRQFEIMGHHNNRLAVALILREHRVRTSSEKGMAMLRIDEPIIEVGEHAKAVSELSAIETRLKPPGWNAAQGLMKHGANLLWARISEYTDLLQLHQLMPLTKKRRHKDGHESAAGANGPR